MYLTGLEKEMWIRSIYTLKTRAGTVPIFFGGWGRQCGKEQDTAGGWVWGEDKGSLGASDSYKRKFLHPKFYLHLVKY